MSLQPLKYMYGAAVSSNTHWSTAVTHQSFSADSGGDVFGTHRDLCGQSKVVGRGIAGWQDPGLVATGYGGDDLRGLRVNYAEIIFSIR